MLRITILIAASIASSNAFADVRVVFAPSPDVPKTLEKAFEEAETTIDCAIYSFNDTPLRTRLKQAVERGVKVRVVMNDADKSKFAESLEAIGVDVRHVTPVMHHKFAIIDGPQQKTDEATKATLLTGSTNWARVSYARYDEDLLVFRNEPEHVRTFQAEFNLLWGHSREFGKTIYGETVAVTATAAEVWFTSANLKRSTYRGEPSFRYPTKLADGVCGKRIIAAIDGAEATIDIATTHFRREDFANALERAIGRGVEVRLLTDAQEYQSRRTKRNKVLFDEHLADKGASVRYKFSSPYWDYRTSLQMHCKYMIVDGERVLTGSLNWSENSELRSFENLVAIADEASVKAYVARFDLKWEYGEGTFDDLLKSIKSNDGKGPCTFKPISLTGEQAAQLRRAYFGGACRPRR